jgi:heme/copper-type cytochrome/quinol oxidase subunit 2
MFLNFGLIMNAVLVALGILWCREMFGRWRRDLDDYRTAKDASTRQALAILWGITAVIVILLLNFSVGILKNLGVV